MYASRLKSAACSGGAAKDAPTNTNCFVGAINCGVVAVGTMSYVNVVGLVLVTTYEPL